MRREWPVSRWAGRFGAAALLIATIASLGIPVLARAAQLTAPAFSQKGNVAEMRFALHGSGGGLSSSAHGNQLWIDLDRTRLAMPPDVFAGFKSPLIDKVSAVNLGNRRARLIVEFNTRADYAMARLPGELLIRMAPAGSDPELASSLREAAERPFVETPPRRAEITYDQPPLIHRSRSLSPSQSQSQPRALAVSRVAPIATIAPVRTAPDKQASSEEIAAITPPRPPIVGEPVVPDGRQPLVVIDPGHGGFDSGTAAAAPIMEKAVALQIALKLAAALKSRGIRSELTRDTDYFVTLGGRTALANQAGADLFVSIHLNSSPDRSTSGIETYYLNNTTDRATIRLARMENESGGNYGAHQSGDLNYILSDMRQNYKAGESARLAGMIEDQTVAEVASNMGVQLNELGAKKGPFYVLVGAQMPAVLVECGFLSNSAETRNLTDDRYQAVLADAIATAIAGYFKSDSAVGNL